MLCLTVFSGFDGFIRFLFLGFDVLMVWCVLFCLIIVFVYKVFMVVL